MVWLEAGLVAMLGLVFGSFVTLAAHRLPQEEPVAATRSRCPSCRTPLGPAALVPLFSWLWQRGKCRYCQAKISARYPLTELSQAALFLAVYAVYGISPLGVLLMLLSVCLLILCLVDFAHYIIPDEIQIAMLGLGLIYPYLAPSVSYSSALASAVLGLAIGLSLRFGFLWIKKRDGLGWGDVKFLPIAGLWLNGMMGWPPFLFYAGIWGILTAVIWRALGKGERFPFGPALAASLFMSLLTPSDTLFYWTVGRLYA